MGKVDRQWYVLACEGGYVGNVFELFNNSPRRPRLAVTDDLQEALVGTDTMIRYWRKMGEEVLGVESRLVPVRFERDHKTKTTRTILETRKDDHGKEPRVYERTHSGRH